MSDPARYLVIGQWDGARWPRTQTEKTVKTDIAQDMSWQETSGAGFCGSEILCREFGSRARLRIPSLPRIPAVRGKSLTDYHYLAFSDKNTFPV